MKNLRIANRTLAIALLAISASVTGHTAEPQWDIQCDEKRKVCKTYEDFQLRPAHISVITRQVYPGVNPDVVKVGKDWFSRFIYRGVLKELKVIECRKADK